MTGRERGIEESRVMLLIGFLSVTQFFLAIQVIICLVECWAMRPDLLEIR